MPQTQSNCGCVDNITYDEEGECKGLKVGWLSSLSSPGGAVSPPYTEFYPPLSEKLVHKFERAQDNCLEVCVTFTEDDKGAKIQSVAVLRRNKKCCPDIG